jgi:ribulose-5-phosphate 4-epimerase/fuculose-1-phosphate aldolase
MPDQAAAHHGAVNHGSVNHGAVNHGPISREPLSREDLEPIDEAKLIFARPPEFDDPATERRHRKERLAAALRLFGRFGFEEGVAGHITARDPEYTDHFWVNPFGVSFKHIRVSDLLLVNHEGKVVQGRHRVNTAAFAIHSAVHQARPDVIGAAHSHSVYGKALSATGQSLEPLTQDACAFYEDHELFDDYTGVVNDPLEGRRIAAALGSRKAAILRNHGLLTAGTSVDAAAWWFITMERSCQAQLAAKAAGPTVSISHENAKLTHEQVGNEFAGWFQFQPLYEQIARTEPDLFD